MGNQTSRSTSSGNAHSHSSSASHGQHAAHHGYPSARRRESIQTLSVKAQAAPPSASFQSAEAHPASLSLRPRSRGRPQQSGTTTTTPLRAAQDTLQDTMGNEQSRPREKPRETTPPPSHTVPTLIEWEGDGDRVYVTGTFAGWNRKYRLHENGPSKKPNVLSAHVHIAPGTHHLMFIVDNDMRISDKLPTAVDYTNILVNYLEVSYDDVPPPAELQKPVQDREAPAGIYPPQTLPPTPPEPAKEVSEKYHQDIPRFLLDLDAPEESSRFARANAAASGLPTPPTLPGFLGKSILNGTTPMKDDSSVLIMPNHTVLNHLATSSIKDNILATSATTRYKQKFLTTIMYKPKEEDPNHVY